MVTLALLALLVVEPAPAVVDESGTAAPVVDDTLVARQRFQRGLAQYDQGLFEQALSEFEASQTLYASPNSALYVARCQKALGRRAEAFARFERAAALAAERAKSDPRYEDTARAAREEGAALSREIGKLAVTIPNAPAGARVLVANRPLAPAAWGLFLPVEPGPIEVRAEAPGHVSAARTVNLIAGQEARVELTLEAPANVVSDDAPVPMGSPGLRRAGWVSLGVGAVAAGAFVTFAVLAARQHADLEDLCGPGPCPTDQREALDQGRFFEGASHVSLGVAAAAGVVGAALLWVGRAPEASTVSVAPGGLTWHGRF